MGVKYSKKTAVSMMKAVSIKAKKLDVGEELTVLEIDDSSNNEFQHALICQASNGSKLRISVREAINYKTLPGGIIFNTEGDGVTGEWASKFRINDTKDRVNSRTGDVIYPINAYVLADKYIKGLQGNDLMDWDEFVKGGLKEDHGFDPVQDYTMEILAV